MRRHSLRHGWLLACLTALTFTVVARSQQVALHVYDAAGNELRWERFRLVEENWRDIQTSDLTERSPLCDAVGSVIKC